MKLVNNPDLRRQILERDNYTCQHCHAKNKEIIFKAQKVYPRYALREGELFIVYKPFIQKFKMFAPAIPSNLRGISYREEKLSKQEVIKYAWHFKKMSESISTDGYELFTKVKAYREKNPHILENGQAFNLTNIRVILHVHHKDGNHKNNEDANLITLCYYCHQEVTGRFF